MNFHKGEEMPEELRDILGIIRGHPVSGFRRGKRCSMWGYFDLIPWSMIEAWIYLTEIESEYKAWKDKQ
jgi:hypothetical protein